MKHRLFLGVFLAFFMLILAACGGSTTSSGAQEVQVSLSEYKVASSVTTFTPGTTYHFVVTNNGKTAHEFMLMPEGMNMGNMPMSDLHKQAFMMIDTVAPGETKNIDYTFTSSLAGQNLEFACHFAGHYEAGMKLPVTISK